jgi:hypothetical protein
VTATDHRLVEPRALPLDSALLKPDQAAELTSRPSRLHPTWLPTPRPAQPTDCRNLRGEPAARNSAFAIRTPPLPPIHLHQQVLPRYFIGV